MDHPGRLGRAPDGLEIKKTSDHSASVIADLCPQALPHCDYNYLCVFPILSLTILVICIHNIRLYLAIFLLLYKRYLHLHTGLENL